MVRYVEWEVAPILESSLLPCASSNPDTQDESFSQKEHRSRLEAIHELISSECRYINQINTVIEVFAAPLKIKIYEGEDNGLCSKLTEKDWNIIFGYFDRMKNIHEALLLSWFELPTNSGNSNSRKLDFGRLSLDNIGTVFVQNLDQFEIYIDYCGHQTEITDLLKGLQNSNVELRQFFEIAKMSDSRCKGLDVDAFLLEPMQRVTRYPLLIKQILHYSRKYEPTTVKNEKKFIMKKLDLASTSSDMDSFQLEVLENPFQELEDPFVEDELEREKKEEKSYHQLLIALDKAESFLTRLNNTILEIESRSEMITIAERLSMGKLKHYYYDHHHHKDGVHPKDELDLLQDTKCLGKRLLIHQGALRKFKSGRKLHGYLFNDLLLLCDATTSLKAPLVIYRKPLPLNEIGTRENVKIKPGMKSFQIVRFSEIITVKAPSVAEKRQWMNLISEWAYRYLSVERNVFSQRGILTDFIGTLKLKVIKGKNLISLGESIMPSPYCIVQLNHQRQKTKFTKNTQNPLWDMIMIFSVHSLDEVLRFQVFNFRPFSQNEYMGQCDLPLHVLEYYNEKSTETITLNLKDVPTGSLTIQLNFKRL